MNTYMLIHLHYDLNEAQKGFADVSTSTVVAALGRINDALKGKESVKLDAIQFIKDQGIETAKLTLEVVPVQEIEIPDNKSGATYSFSRDSLKRLVESVDYILIHGYEKSKEILKNAPDGAVRYSWTLGNSGVRDKTVELAKLKQAIADYEAIYSIKLEVSFGVPLMPPENLAFIGVDQGEQG